ncbi:MAG: 4Fe-4S binding protein [Chloroflexi bacterium]|nr:4Fe-4S binding protein [Chloroflexota bacterium]
MPPKISEELCNGCRLCYDLCPLDVLGFDDDRNVATVLYPDECWHCGVCEIECLQGAVDVVLPLRARGI